MAHFLSPDSNPWAVDSLEDFLVFHCPECGEFCQAKQDFIDHAFASHPINAQALYTIKDQTSMYDIQLPIINFNCKEEDDDDDDIKPDIEDLEVEQDPEDFKRSKKCEECKRIFFKSEYFIIHQVKEHGNLQGYPCNQCDSIVNEIELLDHHESTDSFECPKCTLKWTSIYALTLHLGIEHDQLKPLVCEFCAACFTNADHLRRHRKNLHLKGMWIIFEF